MPIVVVARVSATEGVGECRAEHTDNTGLNTLAIFKCPSPATYPVFSHFLYLGEDVIFVAHLKTARTDDERM